MYINCLILLYFLENYYLLTNASIIAIMFRFEANIKNIPTLIAFNDGMQKCLKLKMRNRTF